MTKRPKAWAKWDELARRNAPLQDRYAKAALKEARAVFGPKFNKPPLRMGVIAWLSVDYAIALALTKYDFADQKKRK